MAKYLYVDNLNVWIEGMRLSAARIGLAADMRAAQEANVFDPSWRIDFGHLLRLVGGERNDLKRALLVGSRPPPGDKIWAAAERSGFEVEVLDRSPISGREKQVDSTIITAMLKDGYKRAQTGNEFILVAGDADYVPPIENLREEKMSVTVAFWSHAISWKLKEAADRIVDLDSHLDELSM